MILTGKAARPVRGTGLKKILEIILALVKSMMKYSITLKKTSSLQMVGFLHVTSTIVHSLATPFID